MKRGTRVRLIKMVDDPDPVPEGTLGTVAHVDAAGTIHVVWDGGRIIGLIPDKDRWQVLPDERKKHARQALAKQRVIFTED